MGQDELDITVEQDVLGMEIWDKLFDVGEERRIAEISFSAGAAEFSLRFLFI